MMTAGKADLSYKFGAGRYLQGRGVLEQAGVEISRFGRRPYVIGGPTALALVRPRLHAALSAAGLETLMDVHPGAVCHEAAKARAAAARAGGCDVVVGVGGGRMMDFAKLVAYYLGSRVVNIPTSIATCAAYTPFSLVYTPAGQTIPGNFCYDLEVAAILVDLDIMANQPVRYVVSGMLDAMGKFLEIKSGHQDMSLADSSLNLYAGYLLTRFTYDRLTALADQVCQDVAAVQVTQALEDVVFINIPLTGIISALSRGTGQSALAHELYYQARLLFTDESQATLHGEFVGCGMIMQLYYNGTPELIEPFTSLLRRLGAPDCLSRTGIRPTAENCLKLLDAIKTSRRVSRDAAMLERLDAAFALIAH